MNGETRLWLFVAVAGVLAGHLLTACPSTPAAGARRMAEARLAVCRRGTNTSDQARPCYAEVQAFCRDAGLERTCGEGGPR